MRPLLLALLLLGTPGCQTVRSFDQGCPGIYSGMRYFVDQWPDLPWDGRVFFVADLPFSAVGDTLLLPISVWSEPEYRPGGHAPGCRWATAKQR